jgi:hypothetical protein
MRKILLVGFALLGFAMSGCVFEDGGGHHHHGEYGHHHYG